jgi:hypothetical protein
MNPGELAPLKLLSAGLGAPAFRSPDLIAQIYGVRRTHY